MALAVSLALALWLSASTTAPLELISRDPACTGASHRHSLVGALWGGQGMGGRGGGADRDGGAQGDQARHEAGSQKLVGTLRHRRHDDLSRALELGRRKFRSRTALQFPCSSRLVTATKEVSGSPSFTSPGLGPAPDSHQRSPIWRRDHRSRR